MLDMVEEQGACYDRVAQLHVRTESGLVGTIVQDVVTRPARKWLRVEGRDGFVEWQVNADSDHDAVRRCVGAADGPGDVEEVLIPKSRPDDFRGEVEHIGALSRVTARTLRSRSSEASRRCWSLLRRCARTGRVAA